MFETCTDYYAILKELRIFAEGSGFNVVWMDDPEEVPHADNDGNIYLHRPDPAWNESELLRWKLMAYHEISHQLPGVQDSWDMLKKHNIQTGTQEILPNVLNCFEDYRIERHKLGEYSGRDMVLSKGREHILKNETQPMFQKVDWSKVEKSGKIFATMVTADTAMRSSWQRDLIGQDTVLKSYLPEEQQEWVDKIVKYKPEFDALGTGTAEDVLALANKIIKEVFGLDPEEEMQKAQAAESDGDGEGGGEGKGKGKNKGKGKDGDGDLQKRLEEGQINYEDLVPHHHNESGATYTPLHINYDNVKKGKSFVPSTNMQVFDYTNGSGAKGRSSYAKEVRKIHHSTGLSNKVRKLLQVRSQTIKIYGQKSGKVAGKSVHRVTMDGSGEYQNKIFRKKIDNTILDTAVTVLADFSGSMGGDKQVHSLASALMLNDTLARIGVPVEILGFTESNDPITYVFKTHQKRASSDQILDYMSSASGHCMGNNADGESILYAYDRLRRQKNKRKLLIVLSDGQPASSREGDINELTKQVVKGIEKKHDVEIYGIGIMSNTVKHIYKHHAVIKKSSELESALLTVISNYILN